VINPVEARYHNQIYVGLYCAQWAVVKKVAQS
jgi:hypothetical protein